MFFYCLAKENAKTAGYGGVILIGVGVTAAMGYTVLRELFAGDSPNALFQKASQVCVDNPKVRGALRSYV